PAPIVPQEWKFRQSIDYSVTANYGVLDLASRNKDHFLYNIYRMGANQIERGSGDHWTVSPEDMTHLQSLVADAAAGGGAAVTGGGRGRGGAPGAGGRGGRGGGGLTMEHYNAVFKDPA